jgi:hypothetical protein
VVFPTVRLALGALLLGAGCGRASAPAAWHDEPGYRWRELGAAGKQPAGFTRLAPNATGIDFANPVSDSAALRNRHLMDGSGVAIGDVNADGRLDLYFCRIEGPNALYLNEGGWRFREVGRERGVALGDRPSTGAVFADVDGDRDLDLVVTAMGGANSLFLNQGDGHFQDATERSGFVPEQRGSTTAALADVDGDGDLDLYVANYKARTMLDSLSPAERAFDRIVTRTRAGFEVIPERRADYRLKHREDLQAVTLVQRADPDWFYLNDGEGRFHREPLAANPRFLDESGKPLQDEPEDFGLAARFYDVNDDGAPDLYVANDFEDPDQFWINDQKGGFRLIAKQAVRRIANSNMAVDFADIDRDGHVDLFQVDMLANDAPRRKTELPTHTVLPKQLGEYVERSQWQRNALLLNRGDGTFAEIADFAGVAASGWSWSALFLDVDLDGYDDLLIGNGHTWDLMDADTQERARSTVTGMDWRRERTLYPPLQLANVAFRNRGDRTFDAAGLRWRWGTEADISHGIAAGDLDDDGDLDVVVNRLNAKAAIMRNDAAAPRIAIRALGVPPNTAAIGARIRVLGGAVPEQSREVTAGGLYLSGSDQELSFAAGPADSLLVEIRWRDGSLTRIPNARPGRLYEIRQEQSYRSPVLPSSRLPALFEDLTTQLNARHAETQFNDYVRQPLLDFQLSQLGPGVSWIDLDADGDDDLLVPDGAGGELAWYRNDAGRWARVSLGVPASELDFTMALGVPAPGGASLLVGRSVYRTRSLAQSLAVAPVSQVFLAPGGRRGQVLPAVAADTASVGPLALADVDADGDLDLFVGNRVTPGTYPVPPSSHLYLNQAGRFVRDPANERVLHLVGLVSGAVFTDVNGDGQPDLVLATEWGPVKLLLNDHARFRDATKEWGLAPYLGGWKGVAAGDFDGDGRMDLLATNWGRNLPVSADSANPLYLFVGNFGDLPAVDFLSAQYDSTLKALAPVTSFPRIVAAIPSVRQRVRTFADFAAATIERVIGPAFSRTLRLQLTTMDHLIFLNRGGGFEARPLPAEAQFAPAFSAVIADFDGDGNEDLFLGQNFSQTELATPKFDAGRGLLLRGDGKGALQPLTGQRSGIAIYGDQRGAAASDYDGDGRTDLAVSQNAGLTRLLHNLGAKPGLRVQLLGGTGNPSAIGAVLRVRYADGEGPAREIHAGAGYWSQDGMVQVLGLRAIPTSVWVRWPGGKTMEAPVPPGARSITIRVE